MARRLRGYLAARLTADMRRRLKQPAVSYPPTFTALEEKSNTIAGAKIYAKNDSLRSVHGGVVNCCGAKCAGAVAIRDTEDRNWGALLIFALQRFRYHQR